MRKTISGFNVLKYTVIDITNVKYIAKQYELITVEKSMLCAIIFLKKRIMKNETGTSVNSIRKA
jgi:hypothetical protein